MSREISFFRDTASPTNFNNKQRFSEEDIGNPDCFQSYNQEIMYPPLYSFENDDARQPQPYHQHVHNPERLSPPYLLEPDFKQSEVNRQSKIRQPFNYYEGGGSHRRPNDAIQTGFYDEYHQREDQHVLFHFDSANKHALINLDRENKLHEAKPYNTPQYFQDTFIRAPEIRTEIRENSIFNSDIYINQGAGVQTQNQEQSNFYQSKQEYDLSYLGSQYSPRQNQAFDHSSGQYIQEDRNDDANQYQDFNFVQSTNEHPNDHSDSTFNSSQKITIASSASSKQKIQQSRVQNNASTLSQTSSSSPRDRLKPSNLTTPLENSEQNNSSIDEEITNKDSYEQSSDNNKEEVESDEIAVQTTPTSSSNGGTSQPQFGRKKREKKRVCKEIDCKESLLLASSKDVNEITKELDLEMMQWVDRDSKVQEQEADLEKLKRKKIQNKKELQIQRNRITAQLSRDRKKLENDFLRGELIKMRKLVADISQSLSANSRDNQKSSSAFCQNCSNLLISHFNLPQQKTRVIKEQQHHCNDNKFEEDKINQTLVTTTTTSSEPSLLQKRKSNGGGAFEFAGSSRVGMKTVAALSIFAIIAFACIAGFQSQGAVELNNNNIKPGRMLYQQQNPLVPLQEAQAPALIRMQSTDLSEIHSAKPMSKELMKFEPDASNLPITEQIVDLSALRASFIDRQTIKLLSQQKEFKREGISFGSDSFLIEDFNNRYIIKPIKATVPAYFDQQLATAPLFQLDDGLSAEDEENDTIVYQPQHQKQKFLNIHTIPKVNNDRSQNNNYQLQNQRYFDRVHQQLDDELTSVYCHASDVIPSTSFDSQLLLSDAYKSHYYSNSRNENDPSNASVNSPLLGINKFHVVIPIDQAHLFSQNGYLPDPDSTGAHPQLVEISGFVEEINYIYQKYPSAKVNL